MVSKPIRGLLAAALLAAAFGLAAGISAAQDVAPDLQLYVRRQGAGLRSEPNLNAALLDDLQYGAALRQVNARGSWYEVEDPATKNKGWIQKDETSTENPVLEPGYGKVLWGQSLEEVASLTGAKPEGLRLVEHLAEGPVEAVAYNFSKGRLWFVEERYRLPPGRHFPDVIDRAQQRFGRPAEDSERRFQNASVWMRAKFQRWDTGPTGFALVRYDPLEEEGREVVHAEYWSVAIAAEEGLGGDKGPIPGLDFGRRQP